MSTTSPLPRTTWNPAPVGSGTAGENLSSPPEQKARARRTSRKAAAFTVLLGLGLISAFFAIQMLVTEPSNQTDRSVLAAVSICLLVLANRVAGPRELSRPGD